MNEILKKTCELFDISQVAIKSSTRIAEVNYARQAFMVYCRLDLHCTLQSIANIVHRSHATVLHSIKNLQQKECKENYEKLKNFINLATPIDYNI